VVPVRTLAFMLSYTQSPVPEGIRPSQAQPTGRVGAYEPGQCRLRTRAGILTIRVERRGSALSRPLTPAPSCLTHYNLRVVTRRSGTRTQVTAAGDRRRWGS